MRSWNLPSSMLRPQMMGRAGVLTGGAIAAVGFQADASGIVHPWRATQQGRASEVFYTSKEAQFAKRIDVIMRSRIAEKCKSSRKEE